MKINRYNEDCFRPRKGLSTRTKIGRIAGGIFLMITIPLNIYATTRPVLTKQDRSSYIPICQAIIRGDQEAYTVIKGVNTTFDLTDDLKAEIIQSGKCNNLDLTIDKEPEIIIQSITATPTVYEIAGEKFGVDPVILEAIHSKETSYSSYIPYKQGEDGYTCIGSSAGAIGVMQFMARTWEAYKIDGDDDGDFDKCEVVDAVFTASNYLRANYDVSGSWSNAIWRYNHSDIYVNEILRRAELLRQGEEIYPLTIKND